MASTCTQKFNLVSKNSLQCFWSGAWTTEFFWKITGGVCFFDTYEKKLTPDPVWLDLG